ncbi:MAG: AAA-like domain-containing protein [Bacteroidia bacterium]
MKKAKRYFNTSGPNIPEQHYTLMRAELVEKGAEMVRNERYFTIWAPRQSGKSTYFRLLATALEKEGYKVCYVNFENYITFPLNEFLIRLRRHLKDYWQIDFENLSLGEIFEKIESNKTDKLVLIIDEVEGINPEYFSAFLHTIRNAYHSRTTHALKSVILVGVANITGIIQDHASPFNTNDSFEVPYFTQEEVFELLAQHERETGQQFEANVKEKIFHITAGQPGLVNGFGLELTKRHVNKELIDYQDYLAVEHWYLYSALDKNVANVINKAKYEQKLMERLLFSEKKIAFDIDDEKQRFLFVNGVIREDKENNVEFWVPLYKKRLQKYFYPAMNGEAEEIQGSIDISDYVLSNGVLNWDKIMRGYQEYAARRGFRYFIQRNEKGEPTGMLEAGLMYSFETYIQSYLQVMKGKSYLEAHVALGRSDLIVNILGNEAVIEGKIYYNITQFTDGKEQLAYYIASLNLTKGIYLVFVNAKINHPKVVESIEIFGKVELTTYLVRYDVEKDFSEPRKRNVKKK